MNLNIVNLGPGSAQMWKDDAPPLDRVALADEQRRSAISQTGIEVVQVSGLLVSRGSHVNMCETMTSYESLRTQLQHAVADPMVESIVLDIDSPGGAAVGAFDLAEDIRAMTEEKPITVLVNFMAYSGGYLLGSACSELVVRRATWRRTRPT